MKKFFLITAFSLIGLVTSVFAQSFPERCEGTWKGTMYIWSKGILRDSVGIVFTVNPLQGEVLSWNWKTQYLSEIMPMTKNYTLIQSQNQENEFLMDEGDGVVLTNYVFENKMYSLFKVKNNWLTACYELRDDQLIFEVTSGEVSKVSSKGVTNYSFDFLQRVVLKKVQL